MLLSTSRNCIFQPRLSGFSCGILHPYTNWEEFRSEAKRLWDLYKASARPQKLSRMGIRYVNRINIPLPIRDFRDYFRTYPELSSDIDPYLSGFFMQLQCPKIALQAVAIVTQGMIPSMSPNMVSILLDIDLSRTVYLPTEEDELWNLFEKFRDCKNEIFEASITNRTRSLFN